MIKRAIFFCLILTLPPVLSHAQESFYCFKSSNNVCVGPVIASPGIIFDFEGRLQFDAFVGAGYGIRFMSDKIYSVGGDILLDFDRNETGKTSARISLVSSLFKVIRLGMGIELREGQKARGYGVFSLGLDFKSP